MSSLQQLGSSSNVTENLIQRSFPIKQHLHSTEKETVCQNNFPSKKQKQQNNSKQDYSVDQKEIVENCKGPICSSLLIVNYLLF